MSGIVTIKGIAARDAFLATVTASQVDSVGGSQTFASHSYLTGVPVADFGGTLIPDADAETGSFAPTPLWSKFTSSITGTVVSQVASASQAEAFSVEFPSVEPIPNGNEIVTVKVQAAKSGSTAEGAFSSSVDLTVSLRNGNDTVASSIFGPLTASVIPEYTFTLTREEIRAINWNTFNVQLSFALSVDTGSVGVAGEAQYIEVDLFKAGIIESAPRDDTLWRIVYDL
jgi:hypothetical protein